MEKDMERVVLENNKKIIYVINKVDLIDVSILLANYGTPKNKTVDLNGDGKVDVKDLSILLSRWSR